MNKRSSISHLSALVSCSLFILAGIMITGSILSSLIQCYFCTPSTTTIWTTSITELTLPVNYLYRWKAASYETHDARHTRCRSCPENTGHQEARAHSFDFSTLLVLSLKSPRSSYSYEYVQIRRQPSSPWHWPLHSATSRTS